MVMKSCFFCSNMGSSDPEVVRAGESEDFLYFWDDFPVTPGHLLVVPKRHAALLASLSTSEVNGFMSAVSTGIEIIEQTNLASHYQNRLKTIDNLKAKQFISEALVNLNKVGPHQIPDAYNQGFNDGVAAGQTVPHFHYHIMPRWYGDQADPRGGIRHLFAGKGNYHV